MKFEELGRGIDYNEYKMTLLQWIYSAAAYGVLLFMLGYVFYRHPLPSLLLALFGSLYPRQRKKELIRRRKEELKLQFQQALYMLSTSLTAGRSLESAIPAVLQDLKMLYPHDDAPIIQEFRELVFKLNNGVSVEKAFHDLSRRAGVEEITQFADVLTICKRTGGNLVEVIRMTSRTIGDKIRIQQEIAVLISRKRFEAKALSILPVGVIALLAFTSADYMEPLYSGIGRIIMTVAFVLLLICQWWCKKLMEIEV